MRDAGNATGFARRACNATVRLLLQHEIAAGVVIVMMRVQNPAQVKFMFRQNLKNRIGHARINDRCRAVAGFMQHIDIIVFAHRDLDDL